MNEQTLDPLLISISDRELNDVLDARIDYAESKYRKDELKDRQETNVRYFLGKHDPNDPTKERMLKDHRSRYMDNIIYESEEYIKPIALSKLPDLLVKATDESEERKRLAEEITNIMNNEIRRRQNRRVIGVAHRHLPLYFIGAVKYKWDSSLGAKGDYTFCHVNPKDIVLDYVPSSNPDDMSFIVHKTRMPLKEVLITFPNKKAEMLDAVFGANTESRDRSRQKGYATPIEIEEVWFSWYKDEDEVRREEFVLWRYKGGQDVILKKMKNPNYDYKGTDIMFTRDEEGNPTPVGQEQAMMAMLGFGEVEQKKVYRNYFQQPRKPFIFINYDWLGNSPYDDTSRIEQVIMLQDNVDIRGKQITDIANTSRGKWAGSQEGGVTKEDMERWDPTNPNQNFHVKEDLDKAFKYYPMEQPSAALYQDQDMNRQRIFSKMGVNDTVRGQVATDTATTAQMAREADFGRIDDLVEETINFLAEEMARAAMHMIKLRYTEEHVRRLIGDGGQVVYQAIVSDMIEDGMEVEVFASGTDKLMRKREAIERASMNLTDPLSFFEDTGASDPVGRTKRLVTYLTDPASYVMNEVEGKTTADMVNTLQSGGQEQPGLPAQNPQAPQAQQQQQPMQDTGGQEALNAIAMIQQGQQPPMPQQITQSYVQTINNFLESPDFANMPPQAQAMFQQFAQQVLQMAQGMI